MQFQEIWSKVPGRRWLLPVVLLCIAVWGFSGMLAQLLSLVAVRSLGMAPAPEVTSVVHEEEKQMHRDDLNKLVERNPFAIVVNEEAPPRPVAVTGAVDENNLSETKLPALLVGTLAGDDDSSLCLIQDTRNRAIELYAVGDMVLNMAKVIHIERQRVILDRNGKQEVLQVPDDVVPASNNPVGPATVAPGGVAAPVDAPVTVRENGEGNFVLDKEEFNSMLTDLGPLLSSARVVPNFEKGKINGYKIFAIKAGSLYESIGLRNGDIIDSINGLRVETPDKALMMFQQLRSEEHFELEVRRTGEAMTFNYDLE